MPIMLSQAEYVDVIGKLKDRRLRSELKRYGYAAMYGGNPEARIAVPLMVMEKINASIRKHAAQAQAQGTVQPDVPDGGTGV